ncbi:MAG: archease [Candidatus Micrarchaeota archaeon]
MPFKILEHIADIGIIAEGKTFENALEETAYGMFLLMKDSLIKDSISAKIDKMEKMGKIDKIEVSVQNEDKEELVVFLFSEILAKCEIGGFSPIAMNVKSYDGKTINVEVLGEYKTLKNIIKAITFHMLEVEQEKDGWKIQILFDI